MLRRLLRKRDLPAGVRDRAESLLRAAQAYLSADRAAVASEVVGGFVFYFSLTFALLAGLWFLLRWLL